MPLDEARLDQKLQMARDAWLRLAEYGHKLGDGQLRLGEEREQAQPCRLGSGGERGQEGFEGRGLGVLIHGSALCSAELYIKICLYCKELYENEVKAPPSSGVAILRLENQKELVRYAILEQNENGYLSAGKWLNPSASEIRCMTLSSFRQRNWNELFGG
jgi:hypothetical protein